MPKEYKVHALYPAPEKLEYEPEPPAPPTAILSIGVKMPSDTRSKLVMLRNARQKAHDRTAAARAKKAEKDAARRSAGEFKWQDVRGWFEDACAEHFPQVSRLPSWNTVNKQNAKRLLEEFGGPAVEKTVHWFFRHWLAYQEASRGRLNGLPTPSLLIVMKAQVFIDCEMDRVPGVRGAAHRVRKSEWDEDEGKPNLNPDEWGLD